MLFFCAEVTFYVKPYVLTLDIKSNTFYVKGKFLDVFVHNFPTVGVRALKFFSFCDALA